MSEYVPPTPTRRWPLLERAVAATCASGTPGEIWVKHENHNPTGAFKVRGGINFLSRLVGLPERPAGLVSATRGNHGQSLAFASGVFDVPVTIVVPEGNSPDKNAAMEAYGAELIVHGRDFQASVEYAGELATQRGLLKVPAFHPWLVHGVATYVAELHETITPDVIYVPIGMGSGAAANIEYRDLIGASTQIVGVVAANAPAYALSVAAGTVVTTPTADTFVDGVACRTPDPMGVQIIGRGIERIVQVSEELAADAMAMMFTTTHNLAEPSGALALAGLLADLQQHPDALTGRRVAIIHTGGNADFDIVQRVMKATSL